MSYIVALQFSTSNKKLLKNAYNCPSALIVKNAYVAQTSVSVAYLRFMKMRENKTCVLDVHHKHTRALYKTQNLHVIVWQIQTLTFMKNYPGHHQTMKYGINDLLGVRKDASGARIKSFQTCAKN